MTGYFPGKYLIDYQHLSNMGEIVALVHRGVTQVMQPAGAAENSGSIFCKTRQEAFCLNKKE